MANPYLAEIRIFAGNFAPTGWAFCDGQILSISQNTALFSLLGTTYGGDGRTTFALPDLRGRAPVHMGQGPGLSNYSIGQVGGQENTTLTINQLPAHNHLVACDNSGATTSSPAGAIPANAGINAVDQYFSSRSSTGTLSPSALQNTGSGQPFPNQGPYLALSFIIALQGIFPPRN